MAANTVLLDFSIEPSRIADEASRKDMLKVIKENLEKYFGNLKIIYDMLVDDGYLCILSDNAATIFTIRFFNEGLITINIEYWKKEDDSQRISFEVCKKIIFSQVPHSISIRMVSNSLLTGKITHILCSACSSSSSAASHIVTNYFL